MENGSIFHEGSEYVKLDMLKSAMEEIKRLKHEYEYIVSENQKLRKRSDIDPLTQVYRRSAAIERINDLLKGRFKQCALIVLDLDNFKYINDTFGHVYGDTVITAAAEYMRSEIGNRGIIGRFGGDEFFIFIPGTDTGTAMNAANNIIKQIIEFGKHTHSRFPLACSCGVAVSDTPTKYGTLFSMADKALYSAKQNGKSHAELFVPEMSSIEGACITYIDQDEINDNPSGEIVSLAIEMASKAATTDDSVHLLLAKIQDNFDIDRIKILAVDIVKDMISVVYDCNSNKSPTGRIKNTVGYYLHTDLIKFRDALPDRRTIRMEQIDDSIYSEKFRREFRDNDSLRHLYYLSKSVDGNYSICYFESSDPSKCWSDDDCRVISELASIAMVYADRVHRISQRELSLQHMLNTDKLTGFYTLGHFFEQSGLIRKLAFENNMHCYVLAANPHNMAVFNQIYSYDKGDMLLKAFALAFENSEFKQFSITAHEMGRFYMLIRSSADITTIEGYVANVIKSFINRFQPQYPDFKFSFSLGAAEVFQNDILLHMMDKAKLNSRIIE
ncbi:MAG: GGDEF domain-containing protein [bacterium]|nr:GGDEF domain-containing protein [bacterium]